jgi:heme exporter protein B
MGHDMALGVIVGKDLRLELRSGVSTTALIALSILILVTLVFSMPESGTRGAEPAAGALWVALIFSGMLGATRSLTAERENGCIRALVLSPVDPSTIYAAKLLASFIFMAIAETASVIMMVLFFNLDFDLRIVRLGPVIALGALGFAALATLLAAISGRTRAGDVLLPLLAVPMFVPALIAGVQASGAALAGMPFAAFATWLKILIAFDVLFVVSGYLLFEYVVGED